MDEMPSGYAAPNGSSIAAMMGEIKIPGADSAVEKAIGPDPVAPVPQPVARPPMPNVYQSKATADAVEPVIDIPNFEEEIEVDPEPVVIPADEDDGDLPDSPAAENFKKLRGVVKAERQKYKELETQFAEVSEKARKFESGEAVSDVIRAKDEKIAELEKYQKAVDIKFTPEYQEGVVKVAQKLRGDLQAYADDYKIPMSVIEQIVATENKKERNEMLSQVFDDVGGLEVKRLIDQLHEVGQKAIDLEKEPEKAMQSLRTQYVQRQEEQARERAKTFEVVAKDGWNAALEKTSKEGIYREFILHPTDLKYNKEVVEPIQHRSSIQYAALVKKLAAKGLTDLDTEFAGQLARMVQLSIAGAMSLEAKAKAESKASALSQNIRRTSGYMRPNIGSQNGSGHGVKAPTQNRGPMNPREAANMAVIPENKGRQY